MTSSMDKIRENLGKNIKKYRKALKLTQFELGVQVDVTEYYIQYLEKGKRMPSMSVLAKLADALRVEPSELLEK